MSFSLGLLQTGSILHTLTNHKAQAVRGDKGHRKGWQPHGLVSRSRVTAVAPADQLRGDQATTRAQHPRACSVSRSREERARGARHVPGRPGACAPIVTCLIVARARASGPGANPASMRPLRRSHSSQSTSSYRASQDVWHVTVVVTWPSVPYSRGDVGQRGHAGSYARISVGSLTIPHGPLVLR